MLSHQNNLRSLDSALRCYGELQSIPHFADESQIVRPGFEIKSQGVYGNA
jgi:hypothetical protein